jgi:hypothetical protein
VQSALTSSADADGGAPPSELDREDDAELELVEFEPELEGVDVPALDPDLDVALDAEPDGEPDAEPDAGPDPDPDAEPVALLPVLVPEGLPEPT